MEFLPTIRRLSTSRHIVSPAACLRLVLTLLLVLAFLSLTRPAAAQNTWNGGNGNWSTAGNWSEKTSPDGSTDITIPSGIVQGDVSFTNRNALDIDLSAELIVLSTTTITNSSSSAGIFNGGSLQNNGIINGDGLTSVINYGSVTNSAGAQMIGVSGFNNKDGSMLSNAGTMSLASLDSDGSIINSAGALLTITVELSVDNGTLLSNAGTLTTFALFNGGTVNNTAGTMQIGGSGSINYGSVNNSYGAEITITGATNNKDASTLNNDGILNIQNSFSQSGLLSNTSNGILNNSSSLTNYQTLTNAGTLNNPGGLSNLGSLLVLNGGTLNNTGSIGNTSGGGFVVQSGGTFNNSGSFLSDYLSSFGSQANSTILNTGDMSLGGNTVAIGGSLRNNGTITMVAGPAMGDPAIQPPAPPLLIASTGKLSGTGTVNQGLFGFGVINQGVMAPGDPLGTFTIIGNYQQTATGTLEIMLGGTGVGQFGQLDITGSADLSGTLDVELFAGFDPQAGEIFEILESGGITNLDFLSTLFPTLPDGLFLSLDREGNNLFLDVMSGSGGGSTSTPEPSTAVLLLSSIAIAFGGSRLRKKGPIPGT
ncbi:MAG: hypothetical protein WBP79_11825 [Candidatus Acidiferrales bacterium]